MNQDERFNNILSECLDRILKGETVEQCLRNYPEQAKELEPLLRMAKSARVVSTIRPSLEFKARARYEFQAALRDMANRKNRRQTFFTWRWKWRSGWAIAIIAVLVVLFAGGGTVAAASNSMPDNALYPVKLATEQVQLAVTPSDLGKAELNAKFADRRANEIVYLASKGDVREVQNVAKRLNTNLQNITNLVGDSGNGADVSVQTNSTQSVNESGPTPQNGKQHALGVAAVPAQTTVPPVATAPSNLAAPMQGTGAIPSIMPTTQVPESEPATKSVPFAPALKAPQTTSGTDASAQSRSGLHQDSQNARDNYNGHNNVNTRSNDREKLKQIIVNDFATRQSRLEEALKKATPQTRSAVRQAIAQSQNEYDKALEKLGQDRNN